MKTLASVIAPEVKDKEKKDKPKENDEKSLQKSSKLESSTTSTRTSSTTTTTTPQAYEEKAKETPLVLDTEIAKTKSKKKEKAGDYEVIIEPMRKEVQEIAPGAIGLTLPVCWPTLTTKEQELVFKLYEMFPVNDVNFHLDNLGEQQQQQPHNNNNTHLFPRKGQMQEECIVAIETQIDFCGLHKWADRWHWPRGGSS